MNSVTTVLPNPGPIGLPIVFGFHTFTASLDGLQLEHYIDGELRATVPPEGFDGYAKAFPDCRPVLNAIVSGRARAAAAAPDSGSPALAL